MTFIPPSATTPNASGRLPHQEIEAGRQSPTNAIEKVGASTIALGSTVSDAAPLPAGTGNVYPVTAADDAVGVVLTASDRVTGRRIYIGNYVSNKILKVYGPSGAVINGASADAAFSSASGKGVMMICLSGPGNTWLGF